MKRLVIIGAGWYGLYTADYLLKNARFADWEICIVEKNGDIMTDCASCFNQCRLHLGFHYPRSHETRTLCRKGFDDFLAEFPHLAQPVTDNYYMISDRSLIDLKTYTAIFHHEKYEFEQVECPSALRHADGNVLIRVKEQFIDPTAVRQHFRESLSVQERVTWMFNSRVQGCNTTDRTLCVKTHVPADADSVLSYDMCIDCSNYQAPLDPPIALKVCYEAFVALLYKPTAKFQQLFGALTVMDGPFFSLYPYNRAQNLFTLTHVAHGVVRRGTDFQDMPVLTAQKVADMRKKIEAEVERYFPDFLQSFEFHSHFCSPKTKLESVSDSRRLLFQSVTPTLHRVSCGKITGVFELRNKLEQVLCKD